MRRFIYYDKNGIESYVAQITSGLTVTSTSENQTETQNETENGKEKTTHSNVGAKIVGIGAEISEDISNKNNENILTAQLVKSIEEKILSDYAFEKVYDYFQKNNLIKNENFEIGNIVSLNECVTFFDFDYFEKLFSENGVYSFTTGQLKENLKKFKESMIGLEKQNISKKNEIKEMESLIKKQEQERKSTLEIINMAKSTLPYTRFVMTNDCLVVLNDNNFRDNPNDVAFKYGGDIEIVGYVTNTINSNVNTNNPVNAFSDIYKFVNQVLLTLYSSKKEVYVIHPLAMFY